MNISMALTPMVLTARLIKKQHPNSKIAFIGPCAAKKLEASRRSRPLRCGLRPHLRGDGGHVRAPRTIDFTKLAGEARRLRRGLRRRPRVRRGGRRGDGRGQRHSQALPRARGQGGQRRGPRRVPQADAGRWPRRASTTATCSRAWPARAAASPVPVPSPR